MNLHKPLKVCYNSSINYNNGASMKINTMRVKVDIDDIYPVLQPALDGIQKAREKDWEKKINNEYEKQVKWHPRRWYHRFIKHTVPTREQVQAYLEDTEDYTVWAFFESKQITDYKELIDLYKNKVKIKQEKFVINMAVDDYNTLMSWKKD